MKYWHETLAVAQRILIELWRRKRSLVLWSIFPVSILVLNVLIIGERMNLSRAEAFEQIAPSTLVGAALFFSCLGGSVSTVVAEREQRTLKRLFISPLSGMSYFLGVFLAHSAIALGQTLLIFTISALAGAELQGSVLLSAGILVLSVIAYVGVGFFLGTQLARRTEDVNALVAAFGVPLLLMGGAFIPTTFFPRVLLELAGLNPIYHMNEALTGVVAEGKGLDEIGLHFWVLAGFALAMVLSGWLAYRRMLRAERRL